MARAGEVSVRLRARLAGVFYVLTGGAGFAFFVRGKLLVAGDAAATARNVAAHEGLFRDALAADVVGVACYVVVTVLLYELLRPVSRVGSLAAAAFSLVGCTIEAAACIFQAGALVVLHGGQVGGGLAAEQARATALMLLGLQDQGFAIAIVYFGFYCLLTGCLILRSTFLPRIVGALMALAGVIYAANNLATFLALPVAGYLHSIVMITGGLGEGSLMLWLLVMGVDARRWHEQARKS